MKIRNRILAFFISIILIAALLGITSRAIHAQGSSSCDPAVLAKLDSILNNQKSIMEDLAFIKEELRIIKIRVTQSQ